MDKCYYIDRASKIIEISILDPEPAEWVFSISYFPSLKQISLERHPEVFVRPEAQAVFEKLREDPSLINHMKIPVDNQLILNALETLIILPSPNNELKIKS